MTKQIRFDVTGGPEVLKLQEVAAIAPGPSEAWIEQEAIGVNFLDVTHRNGAVPVPIPSGLGVEGSGRVVSIGEGVQNVTVGDRVAYVLGPLGSYASARLIPVERLVRIPDELSFDQAAAIMLKGLTAQYLLKAAYPVDAGTIVLMYGVAGALGQIMAPWAKHLGAKLIGVVSKESSVASARSSGCDEVLIWDTCDLPQEVARITGGAMADVVYDGVGRTTFDASLDCLRARGTMVSIGATSGIPDPIDIRRINKTSLYVTRPSLVAYVSDPVEYAERATDLFGAIRDGIIEPKVWHSYPLDQAAEVHKLLEHGDTKGAVLLKP
ncbi:MAG: quinone oxidoreductase family protein [Rhodanobacteraceae bacterium]